MPTRAASPASSRPAAGSSRTPSRAPAGAGGRKAGGGKAGGGNAGGTSYDDAALLPLLEALVAVRDGNFRQRLRPQPGLLGEIAGVVNELVEHNAHVAGELARVRRLVGREGRLGERLEVGTLKGSWAESVEAANFLVEDLVRPTVEVGRVIAAVAEGDLSPRIELRGGDAALRGEFLRVGRTVNSMVDQLELFTSEVTRVAREVGTEGKLGGQARVRGVSGSWKDLTDSVNSMATG